VYNKRREERRGEERRGGKGREGKGVVYLNMMCI